VSASLTCIQPLFPFDEQQLSFKLNDNGKVFGFTAVYASTCYLKRRELWNNLNVIFGQNNIPWCLLVGDFNALIGAHEHRGASNPARLPMEDFHAWSDANNLIHLPTKGAFFTWSNGRRGSRNTQRRLDRAICNKLCLDMCTSISSTILIKTRSDNYPLLLDFQNSNSRFASQFRFMKMWSLHNDCKNVISICWNTRVIGCLKN
jgi:hypothetical protein